MRMTSVNRVGGVSRTMNRLPDAPAASEIGQGLRVLIIDDEPFHAETLAESLARVGYDCVVATSGSEGARRIDQEDFDVILTDLKMEDMDGLSLLRKAKQESPEAEV